jgi:hypothetical protein
MPVVDIREYFCSLLSSPLMTKREHAALTSWGFQMLFVSSIACVAMCGSGWRALGGSSSRYFDTPGPLAGMDFRDGPVDATNQDDGYAVNARLMLYDILEHWWVGTCLDLTLALPLQQFMQAASS